jgi:hypothetical protein
LELSEFDTEDVEMEAGEQAGRIDGHAEVLGSVQVLSRQRRRNSGRLHVHPPPALTAVRSQNQSLAQKTEAAKLRSYHFTEIALALRAQWDRVGSKLEVWRS